MLDGWRQTELGNVLTLQRGFDLPIQERREGNIPVVSSSGITGKHSKAMVTAPGVITGRYGTIGQIFFLRENFWPLNTTLFVKDFKGNDPLFVYYLLKTIDFASCSDKSSVPGVNRNHLHSLPVSVPESAIEQRAIAQILGALDDKIELNRRTNETLEAMARTIFKSWFVDFDPVHARYEGRETPLSKEIADLFPAGLCESALGPIPIGWDLTTWGTLVSLEYGKALSGYDTEQGAYPVYGTNGRIGTHSQALCPHAGVIIGRKGAYRGVHYSITPFFAIDTAFYVKPKVPLELRWAYYDLLGRDINNMDSGSAIPSTSRDDFYALEVIFPPVEVQRRYTKLLDPMWRQQQQNLASIRTLAALRDALLPKLISGEVRVNAVNRFAETIA